MIDFGEKLDVLCSTVEVHKFFLGHLFALLSIFVGSDHKFINIEYIVVLFVGYSWL